MSAQQAIPPATSETNQVDVPSRVVTAVNDAALTTLQGNTHPLARPAFDRGPVAPSRLMERMLLVLKRSPEQEAALEAFNERQYDPASPDFHHWLDPEEFGRLYGPSDADISAVTNWLQNHGFRVDDVSKGRINIEFTGTVEQVQNTFHVQMRNYLANSEAHIANDRDPQIPVALAPVVVGVASLHNFFPKPQLVLGPRVNRDPKTGRVTLAEPLAASSTGGSVEFTYTDGGGNTREDVVPYDFATIYNELPLWNASTPINGKGVTIAISGISDVATVDFQAFRAAFGLPATTLNIIHNGSDPGFDPNGGQQENTLDVEWSGASAPGANITMVVTGSTATTFGGILSNNYIVQNKVAPIMSASYGGCELGQGTAGNAALNTMYQQAVTQGISAFVSSGDQGSAGCTSQDGTPPFSDKIGLQVNGWASTPYVTGVGGTDLNWKWWLSTGWQTYWNAANGAQNQTAKGYIPEVPWNSTCTSTILLPLFTVNGQPASSAEQLCNAMDADPTFDVLVAISAGSGGVSHCTTSNGSTPASCSGGYAKPSWQSGPGVPADGKRDVPDVSLFASGGISLEQGSAFLYCEGGTSATSCNAQEIGGTSASAPAMAGIMALVVQKQGGAKQGLANPPLYVLASGESAAACATASPAASCVFNDITAGTNAQVCTTGDTNCVTNTSGDTLGVLSGYNSGVGYDLTTGLGSVNVNNLVGKWASAVGAPAVTLTPTSLAFASTVVGSTTAAQVVTIKNSGTATLNLTSETITGTNATSFIKSATTCGTTLAAAATCTVSVEFKPATTGALSATLSIADNATGSPQAVALTGTGTAPAVTLTPTSLAFASTVVGLTTAAQVVTIKNSGTATLSLTSETITGTNATSFIKSATTCGTTLAAAATCTVSVEFKPAAIGALSASLSIADNAAGSPQAVKLTGTGVTPVTLTPTSLAFASTLVGSTTAAQVVTIKNVGASTLNLTSETITGTNATSFIKSATTCGTTLAAAATCTVSVEFRPATTGTLSALLSIADSGAGSPQTATLTGTGVAPAVSLTPASIAFPASIVGTTSAEETVTLKNTGTATLTISTIVLGGTNPTSFVEIGTCGASLAAGASCLLYVGFKPASAVALSATLGIADNAAGSPHRVTLTGTGTAAPTMKLSTTSITFPTTLHGTTSAASTITLTNGGTATVKLSSIALAGTNPTDFVELNSCGATLAPAGMCSVYVAFKPAAAGSFTATLVITDNGAASPQTVTLKGTAN
jgi:subtilase family serine protease